MKIDVLYFQGCPNHKPTVERVRQVIDRLGVTAEIREVELTQDSDPAAMKFLGSPTILIDGLDIDPAQREGDSYGFGCRTFGGAGMPAVEMIERAVSEASDPGGGDGDHDCCSPQGTSEQLQSKSDESRRMSFGTTPAAVGSAILSSACCWLPLLLLAVGLSAGGVAGFFETVRPYFLIAAVVFLCSGFYFAYFRRPVCKPGDACAVPSPKIQRFNRVMLWAATVFVIAFALFPYYSPALVRAVASQPTVASSESANRTDADTVSVTRTCHVEGMTCAACAAGLEVRLSKLPGVAEAKVSYADGVATIQSPSDQPSIEKVRAAVEDAGFSLSGSNPE